MNKVNLVPDSLKDFVSSDEDGYVFANQKLPRELEKDYNTFIKNYYTNDNEIVNNIIDKINNTPLNIETTIAQLINYNPDVSFVSPMTQGIIANAVQKKCRKKGIILIKNRDEIGGLAYYDKFKKVNFNGIIKLIIKNMFSNK